MLVNSDRAFRHLFSRVVASHLAFLHSEFCSTFFVLEHSSEGTSHLRKSDYSPFGNNISRAFFITQRQIAYVYAYFMNLRCLQISLYWYFFFIGYPLLDIRYILRLFILLDTFHDLLIIKIRYGSFLYLFILVIDRKRLVYCRGCKLPKV